MRSDQLHPTLFQFQIQRVGLVGVVANETRGNLRDKTLREGRCGFLDASVASFERAQRLDPNVVTSVCHTFWMLGDTRRAVETERQGTR